MDRHHHPHHHHPPPTVGSHEAYKEAKETFDRAEVDYELAHRAFKEAEQALQEAKEDMDRAYQRWTTKEDDTTSAVGGPAPAAQRGYPLVPIQKEAVVATRKRGYEHDDGPSSSNNNNSGTIGNGNNYGSIHINQDHPGHHEEYPDQHGGGDYHDPHTNGGDYHHDQHHREYDQPPPSQQRRFDHVDNGHYPEDNYHHDHPPHPDDGYHHDTHHHHPDDRHHHHPHDGPPPQGRYEQPDPSIFIPFVHTNIRPERIQQAIEEKGWGLVDHVDLVALPPRPNKPPINRAYIHFVTWHDTPEAEAMRQRYLNLRPGGHVPLVYDEPWFWKTMPNKPPAKVQAAANGTLREMGPPRGGRGGGRGFGGGGRGRGRGGGRF